MSDEESSNRQEDIVDTRVTEANDDGADTVADQSEETAETGDTEVPSVITEPEELELESPQEEVTDTVEDAPAAEEVVEVLSEVPEVETQSAEQPIEDKSQETPESVSEPKISPGPYTLVSLIQEIPTFNQEIEETKGAVATAIESWELNIYVGTSKGELLHFFKLDDEFGYMLISRQRISTKSLSPVKKIVIIPSVSRALILCNSAVSCFMMPEMSPANIGKVKDVQDISLDISSYQMDLKLSNKVVPSSTKNNGVIAVLYTSKSLRFVLISSHTMKLVRDMNYPNIRTGVRCSSLSVIGTSTNYDILDLEKGKKTNLFPLSSESQSSLQPIVVPISLKEFLLACGGRLEDPAIGMIVNTAGDVSRGTIPWLKYPDNFICDYPHVLASFGPHLEAHSIQDQQLLQTFEFSKDIKVANVSHIFHRKLEDIVDIIRLTPLVTTTDTETSDRLEKEHQIAMKFANVSSSSVVYSAEEGVKLLLPAPMLKRILHLMEGKHLESMYDDIEDEIKAIDKSTEYGTIQYQFSRIASCLTLIKHWEFGRAFDYFIDNELDPRIVVFLFGQDLSLLYGEFYIYNGLKEKLEQLRQTIQELLLIKEPNDDEMVLQFAMNEFYNMVIKNYFKNKKIELEPLAKHAVQVIYFLNELDSANFATMKELDDFVKKIDVQFSSSEIIEQLNKRGLFLVLTAFCNSLGEYTHVVKLLMEYDDSLFDDQRFSQIFQNKDDLYLYLVKYISNHITEEDLIWTYGQWLLEKSPTHGLSLFQSPDLKAEISDLKVIRMFDSKKYHDLTTKYLQVLLLDRNEIQFIGDLIYQLVHSIRKEVGNSNSKEMLEESVISYKKIESPKLTFAKFFTINSKKYPNASIFELHNHLFNYLLVASNDTTSITKDENVNIIKYCQQKLSQFANELPYLMCLIDFKLGEMHECVNKLCALTDYKTAEFVATMLTVPYNLPNNSEKIDIFIDIHRSKVNSRSVTDLEDEDATLAVRSIATMGEGDESLTEALLLQIFENYLQLNNFKLIESFLDSHHLFDVSLQDVDGIDKFFDKFKLILTKLPASFPIALINKFLITTLITLRDAELDKSKQKNLAKATNKRLKNLLDDLGSKS